MSSRLVIFCDNCGIEKRQVNHWWKVWLDQDIFHCSPAEQSIYLTDCNGEPATKPIKDICGQACAMVLYGLYLQYNALEVPAAKVVPMLEVPYKSPVAVIDDDIPF
jgi:hypothetical protein